MPRYKATSHQQATSTGTADVQTVTPPSADTAKWHCAITVETTSARVTFDGTTPSATNGLIVPKDAMPFYIPVAGVIKFAAASAGNSILNVAWVSP